MNIKQSVLWSFVAVSLSGCASKERATKPAEGADAVADASAGSRLATPPTFVSVNPLAPGTAPVTGNAAVAAPVAGAVPDPHAPKPADLPVMPGTPAAPVAVDAHGVPLANASASAPPTAAKAVAKDAGVAADISLRWLKNGNIRYMRKRFRTDGKGATDRLRLLKGQHPHAIVLSCSDSRVPPEHVFDQELGEIFVVRVAGEALDTAVIASIEYAAEHLGSHLLVVLGHEACGAVKTALTVPAGQGAGSPSLDALLADIRPRISAVARKPVVDDVKLEASANAQQVAADLLLRSPMLKRKVDSGELKIVSGLYNLGPGNVQFFE